ncbi:MAG: signal peptidase I [Jatrophihabitantaceae bacterium]
MGDKDEPRARGEGQGAPQPASAPRTAESNPQRPRPRPRKAPGTPGLGQEDLADELDTDLLASELAPASGAAATAPIDTVPAADSGPFRPWAPSRPGGEALISHVPSADSLAAEGAPPSVPSHPVNETEVGAAAVAPQSDRVRRRRWGRLRTDVDEQPSPGAVQPAAGERAGASSTQRGPRQPRHAALAAAASERAVNGPQSRGEPADAAASGAADVAADAAPTARATPAESADSRGAVHAPGTPEAVHASGPFDGSEAITPPKRPGRSARVRRWLFARAPERVDEPSPAPAAVQQGGSAGAVGQWAAAGTHPEPLPTSRPLPPGTDLARRLAAVHATEAPAAASPGTLAWESARPKLAPAERVPPRNDARPRGAESVERSDTSEPAGEPPPRRPRPRPLPAAGATNEAQTETMASPAPASSGAAPGNPAAREADPAPDSRNEPGAGFRDRKPQQASQQPAFFERPEEDEEKGAGGAKNGQADEPKGTKAADPDAKGKDAKDKDAKGKKARLGGVRRRLRTLLKIGLVLLIVAGVAALLRAYVAAPYYIPSASMEPTLHGCPGCNNDHILVDKISYHLRDIQRGDVVVFNRPASWQLSESVLVKRVIGVPGDTLTLKGGRLSVNGLLLQEPYLNPKCPPMTSLGESPRRATSSVGPLPGGQLFVMGDNRCDSVDSRAYGTVPESDVIGRAFAIIWPLGRFGGV